MARIELSNIGGGGGTTLSLTTTGTSGAATLAGSVLNIPIYQGALTLTTTGTSGAATLVGNTLNIPNYATGGTPAGSAGQVQFNSTPAGSFAASANLAWDNSATQLNIGVPSGPTGKLNIKGGGATSSTVNLRLTNSGNTELVKVLDNGNTNIGTVFNWDNTNGRLGIGTSSPSYDISIAKSGGNSGIEMNSANNAGTDGGRNIFLFRSARNTLSSPSANNNGDALGEYIAGGYNGSAYVNSASMSFYVDSGTISASSFPSYVGFETTASGSTTRRQVLRILGSGNVIIQTGGTFVDNGQKLQVYGTILNRGSNTSSGTNALLVQNSTPSDLYKIENNGKISYWATNTAAGTTGAQTIDRPSGTVNFGIGATTLVVTNSLCTTSSLVFAEVRTNDATAYIKNVVPAAGSFTINLGAAATAETSVGFFIIN